MKKIKLLSLLLAAIISGTFLTGCGDPESSSMSNTVSHQNQTSDNFSENGNDISSKGTNDTASYTKNENLVTASEEVTCLDEKMDLENNDLVKAVMDNENVWLSDLKSYDDYININYTGESQVQVIDSSRSYCWFQDMDIDGNPEFIVSGRSYSNSTGSNSYPISIYYLDDNGKFSNCPYIDNSPEFLLYGYKIFDGMVSGVSAIIDEPMGKHYKAGNYFDCPLYQNSDGKYTYLSAYMYDIVYSIYCFDIELKKGCQKVKLMEFYDTSETGTHIISDTDIPEYKEVSLSELKKWYHSNFSDMTPYKTKIKTIDIENYQNMSDTAKETVLGASYTAWSYEKDYATERPLESKMNSIIN